MRVPGHGGAIPFRPRLCGTPSLLFNECALFCSLFRNVTVTHPGRAGSGLQVGKLESWRVFGLSPMPRCS
jgi:hypothetical protein